MQNTLLPNMLFFSLLLSREPPSIGSCSWKTIPTLYVGFRTPNFYPWAFQNVTLVIIRFSTSILSFSISYIFCENNIEVDLLSCDGVLGPLFLNILSKASYLLRDWVGEGDILGVCIQVCMSVILTCVFSLSLFLGVGMCDMFFNLCISYFDPHFIILMSLLLVLNLCHV